MRRFADSMFMCSAVVLALAACEGDAGSDAQAEPPVPLASRLEASLSVLAADSMEGRRTGTEGAHRAARFLAAELERYGVEPAGDDDGYLQHVPLAWVRVQVGGATRERLMLPSDDLDFDTIPDDRILTEEANVVGIVRGSDPAVSDEVVVIGAHYDHVGIGEPVDGSSEGTDSIYNGADDDASGTVAILEIARDLVEGPSPRRTVVVLLSTGEESGLLGTRWYIENPVASLSLTVANLQIEMIGRPDPEAGGFGRGWLTGYERTTMGNQLTEAGSPIVPDPRPEMNFFFRSDNIAFARIGIPAHTLSSYNMHTDYHQPSDEIDEIDFQHMEALVEAAIEAVRFLTDGPTPSWTEGGMEGLMGY